MPPQFIAAAQVFGELFQHDKRGLLHVPGYPRVGRARPHHPAIGYIARPGSARETGNSIVALGGPGDWQIYFVSNEQTVPGKRYISGEAFHTDDSQALAARSARTPGRDGSRCGRRIFQRFADIT